MTVEESGDLWEKQAKIGNPMPIRVACWLNIGACLSVVGSYIGLFMLSRYFLQPPMNFERYETMLLAIGIFTAVVPTLLAAVAGWWFRRIDGDTGWTLRINRLLLLLAATLLPIGAIVGITGVHMSNRLLDQAGGWQEHEVMIAFWDTIVSWSLGFAVGAAVVYVPTFGREIIRRIRRWPRWTLLIRGWRFVWILGAFGAFLLAIAMLASSLEDDTLPFQEEAQVLGAVGSIAVSLAIVVMIPMLTLTIIGTHVVSRYQPSVSETGISRGNLAVSPSPASPT
jgi:hypothetical protein